MGIRKNIYVFTRSFVADGTRVARGVVRTTNRSQRVNGPTGRVREKSVRVGETFRGICENRPTNEVTDVHDERDYRFARIGEGDDDNRRDEIRARIYIDEGVSRIRI